LQLRQGARLGSTAVRIALKYQQPEGAESWRAFGAALFNNRTPGGATDQGCKHLAQCKDRLVLDEHPDHSSRSAGPCGSVAGSSFDASVNNGQIAIKTKTGRAMRTVAIGPPCVER
jgi:hypothetical protein